jgi:hypothetical protein
VCDQQTSENEGAKAQNRAVKIQPQWFVTAGKQQQQQQQQHRFRPTKQGRW